MLLQPATTEKTRAVLERAGIKPGTQPDAAAEKKKRKGHGRKPASAFAGAPKVEVKHPTLHSGDRCPECIKGKLYPLKEPAVRVRIIGQAPVQATVYELARLRCNLCQEVYESAGARPDGRDQTGRDGGQHGGGIEVRQWSALLSAGRLVGQLSAFPCRFRRSGT